MVLLSSTYPQHSSIVDRVCLKVCACYLHNNVLIYPVIPAEGLCVLLTSFWVFRFDVWNALGNCGSNICIFGRGGLPQYTGDMLG